jgi:DNA-binding transcriptional ArsR family regulator
MKNVATIRARRPTVPKHKTSANIDLDMLLKNALEASEFLKALSHEVRLLILCFLIEGEKSVSEIEKMLKLRQPAVSQQLARLRADGLVETRRNGKNIYYSLARSEVRDVIEVLHRAFCGTGARR